MGSKTIELDRGVVEKIEAAKFSPEESFSDVMRRAQFPPRPRTGRDLLEEFERRAGHSPLSDAALEQLAEAQRSPKQAASHWGEH